MCISKNGVIQQMNFCFQYVPKEDSFRTTKKVNSSIVFLFKTQLLASFLFGFKLSYQSMDQLYFGKVKICLSSIFSMKTLKTFIITITLRYLV